MFERYLAAQWKYVLNQIKDDKPKMAFGAKHVSVFPEKRSRHFAWDHIRRQKEEKANIKYISPQPPWELQATQMWKDASTWHSFPHNLKEKQL